LAQAAVPLEGRAKAPSLQGMAEQRWTGVEVILIEAR